MVMEEEGVISQLGPGETAGPFEIVIPHELLIYFEWRAKTTRWERFLIQTHLMRKARRRAVYMRLVPWFEKNGWGV